jgi:pimeloyl-ACP methyl ester carboxylesterase
LSTECKGWRVSEDQVTTPSRAAQKQAGGQSGASAGEKAGPKRPTLVLLPGALCDAGLWRHQIADLADLADVRCGDLTRDDSIAAMAARVLAEMPARFALVGFSLGGHVALEIMRRAPDRVSRLALIAATAGPEAPGEVGMLRPTAGATPMMTLLVHPMRLGDRRLAALVSAMADRVGRKAYLRQQRAILSRSDSRPGLSNLRCPVMILGGLQDPLAAPSLLKDMATAIPNARLVVIEDCGHLAPLERPEAVTRALRDWLAERK